MTGPSDLLRRRTSRSGRSGRFGGTLVCLLTLCLGCLGWLLPGLALAQDEGGKKTVAVLEVVGAPRVQAVIMGALKKSYRVLPAVKWNAAARRLHATGHAADEIATVASELNIDAVVTATVKKDKEAGIWVLSVSPRHGASGKVVGRLKYPLQTQRVDAATLRQLAEEIGPAVDKAVVGEKEAPPPVAEITPEVPNAPPPGRDDDPLERLRKAEEDEKRRQQVVRPKWYPFIDANVGVIAGGRSFSFTEQQGNSPIKCYDFVQQIPNPSNPAQMVYQYGSALTKCPSFSPSASAGLRIDLTGYPLAWLRWNALRGLGLGATFDIPFWQPSKVCNASSGGVCTVFGNELQTSEFRAEFGLRWAWNVLNKRSRPSLLFDLEYGLHRFAIQKDSKMYPVMDSSGNTTMVAGVDDHGLPDILYQYIDLGIGARVPYYSTDRYFLGLLFDFHYHIMLNYGDIASKFVDITTFNGGYGPVEGGYGLRASLTPLELMPWKGLTVRVQGYYEIFSMNFLLMDSSKGYQVPPTTRDPTDGARHLAQGATDQYFGGTLTVGYQY